MLRTIGNNFANAAQKGEDIEYTVDGVTKSLSLLDETTGDLKPTFEIFKDLKEDWDNMTDAEKQALGITYAGKNQFEVFAAVMGNFETALRASETAYESSGSAAEENAKAMESIEGKIRALKAAWEELATGTIGKEFLGNIIDAGTKLLEFANTDMGQAITKAVLFGGAVTGITGVFGSFVSNIGGAIGGLKTLFTSMSTAQTGGKLLISALAKPKWTAIALAIGAVVAIIVGLSHVIDDSKSAYDRYMEKAEASQQKIEEYQRKTEEAQKKLEELNKIPWADRTSAQQHEIELLKDQIEHYERLIELEKQRRSEALKKASDKAIGDGVKMGVEVSETTPLYATSDIDILSPKQRAAVDALPKTFSNVTEAIDAYANALGISWVKADGTIKTMAEMRDAFDLFGFDISEITVTLEDAAVDFQNLANSINQGVKPTQKQLNLAKDYIDANKQIADSLWARINNGDKLSDAESQWLLSYNNLLNAYENGQAAVDKYNASVKTAQDTLSKFPEFERASRSAIETVAKALINNSDLGIKSTGQLKSALQNLAEGGVIDLSRIGNIDEFIQGLTEIEGFDFSSKTVDITTDDSDAIQGIDEVASELESIPENIIANISTTSDAETFAGSLDALKSAIERFPKTPVVVNVDIVGADVALSMLNTLASYELPTLTQYVNIVVRRSGISGGGGLLARATGTNYSGGGPTLINDGAPVNGSAGELVVSDGMATIYNNGEETIQNIPRGAKIYNAADTQKILKRRGLTVKDLNGVVIPAMADGTTNNKYPDYRFDPNYSGVANLDGADGNLKEKFNEWLKEKKHFLALDIITEAQYYRDLEIMNERYLKDMADYRDDYWRHEEEIYDWRNQSLEKQLELEEKLSDLAKAKTQRVLTYTGGRFQYLQNLEAIASAQREVDELRGRYANGTTNARGGLSLVGENGPELRVLKNGDGIIPADATKNLMSLSKFNLKDFVGAAASNIKQYAFNISNLSLPNVQSPEDFIDGLRNMAYQYSFSRT